MKSTIKTVQRLCGDLGKPTLVLITVLITCACGQKAQVEPESDKEYIRPPWELSKLTTPIAELTAQAQAAIKQRPAMKLAYQDAAVRPQYAEVHHLLAAELFSEALPKLTELGEQGYADAQFDLYMFYDHGNPGPYELKDDQTALNWLFQAVDQGHPLAQASLGFYYHHGDNRLIKPDWATAAKWMTISAEQGYATSQEDLAFWYHLGEGVEQDPIESYKWYQLALNRYRNSTYQGIAPAQIEGSLGYLIDHFQLTEAQIREAEARAEQWEQDHPWAYQSRDDLKKYSWSPPEDFPPPEAVKAKLKAQVTQNAQ